LVIRRATAEDADRFVQLEGYAYGATPDHEPLMKERFLNAPEQNYIVEEDTQCIAGAQMIPLEQNIRGVWKKMGGVSNVASAPEVRRKGHVRDLMLFMLKDLHDDAFAVSTLYPFKDLFYGAVGYTKMPPIYWVDAHPRQFKPWSVPSGYSIKRTSIEGGLKDWRTVHDQVVSSIHGAARRPDKRWKELTIGFKSKLAIAYGPQSEPEGYMVYKTQGYGQFGSDPNVGTMVVREMLWTNPQARSTLLNFIYLHTDQMVKVSLIVSPMSNDFYHWIEDVNIPTMRAGFSHMARIVDVEQALSGIKVSDSREIQLRVEDPQFAWNNQIFQLSTSKRKLAVERLGNSSTATTISIQGLTSLLYGTLSLQQIEALNWLRGEKHDLLSRWFTPDVPWLIEDF